MSVARGRVLLVDDDPSDLEFFGHILGACGYEVLFCASFPESLDLLAQEALDCVVVSQGSQAFEGRIVVECAIEHDRDLPVLVLARCLDMRSYLEAMQLGAADYLEKPVSPEQIEWVVGTHARRRPVAA